MLTSDLVRFRKSGGRVVLRRLDDRARARLGPVARDLIETYRVRVGATLSELDEAAEAVTHEARDRLVVAGLRKLCDDRTTLDRPDGLDPTAVRLDLFARAARAHREAGPEGFDRSRVLAASAEALGCSPADLEGALFADLREAQIVRAFDAPDPEELLRSYDVALAQAALLRARRVVVCFDDASPVTARALFRAARFHGLLFAIALADGRYEVTFDGPFSLFGAAQKYGLKLALLLPSVLALPRFELRADLVLGARREEATWTLSEADRLAPERTVTSGLRAELVQLAAAFRALGSDWDVAPSDELLHLGGQAVAVPDLSFCHRGSGEVVYLELFGFWSREAVWRRIEQIEASRGVRLLLAVSKKLRVSRDALDETSGSSVIVFGSTLGAKVVLERLEAKQ